LAQSQKGRLKQCGLWDTNKMGCHKIYFCTRKLVEGKSGKNGKRSFDYPGWQPESADNRAMWVKKTHQIRDIYNMPWGRHSVPTNREKKGPEVPVESDRGAKEKKKGRRMKPLIKN